MAVYRYFTTDLLTGQPLADLPLNDTTLDVKLNAAGPLSTRLPLADPLVRAIDPVGSTLPGRTALYVDRDGVLLWGGIIWMRRYSSKTGSLLLDCAEFESWLSAQLIATDTQFVGVDQLAITQALVNTAQAAPNGNIGITVGTETSGVLRDRTYDAAQLTPVLQAIQQMGAADNGFDFAIDVAYSGTSVTKSLHLGYPRRGVTARNSGLVFEHPGNIQEYEWPEDATQQATTVYAVGSGVGAGRPVYTQTNTDLLDAGYPALAYKSTYIDIDSPAALLAHAKADAKAFKYPVSVPKLTVRGDLDPLVGSYTVGDEIRVRITDDRFPGTPTAVGLDTAKRIIAIQVKPPGAAAESVTLTLGDVVS